MPRLITDVAKMLFEVELFGA